MPAIPPHDTKVVDEPWDAQAQVDKIKEPIGKSVGADEWAWYDASGPDPDKDGYPDEKGDYKFPHHLVNADGTPGAAVVSGVRNGLARLNQADIPDGDRAGVKKHLQHHLDAFDRSKAAARAEAHVAELEAEAPNSVIEAASIKSLIDAGVESTEAVNRVVVTNEPEPEPQGPIVSAGYSDLDLVRSGASLEMILGKPWAITREAAVETATRLAMMAQAGFSADVLAQAQAAMKPTPQRRAAADGGEVAVIPLRGTITPRGTLFSMLFGGGGGGLQAFRAQFKEAIADSSVSAVVLDIDSPGGLIDLVTETASDVYKARGSKPIVAVANTTTASAAYWIASQADSVVSTPSGMVGSIGVFTVHEDYSKMEAMMGIKTTLISAGDHKTDGNPYQPLSKSALASIQDEVDQLYDMFTAQVAEGRGISQKVVKAGYGNGKCLLAGRAFQLGMVDRIDTLEATVARLGGAAQDPSASAEDLLGVGDGDEDDGITASAENVAEALAELGETASANKLASNDAPESAPDKPAFDYLSGLREQSPWAL